jgi:hypothetical protein
MILKDIAAITERDLKSLIENSVLEQKTLDYKRLLPGDSDSEKKEFLADVSSFANASGGDLIYGISQDNKTGIPTKLEGLEIPNADQVILKLESSIRDGIEPRIPSVTIRPIPLSDSKIALIIRIQKSWNSPHRVGFKGGHKFYSRSSNGKYELDIAELRAAFTFSETIFNKIKQFREERISKINANETPIPFYENAKIILHLIPVIAFNPAQRYDIDQIADNPQLMAPICCSGYGYNYNLDGFLTYHQGPKNLSHSYVQLFRNGIVEIVEGLLLKPDGGQLLIPSVVYEEELIKELPRFLSVLSALKVELPIFLFLSLVGVRGYSMATGGHFYRERSSIDRDVVALPEVIVENYSEGAERILKPCFDFVWNACGLPRSQNFSQDGKWMPRR